jgi:hypothetical protein
LRVVRQGGATSKALFSEFQARGMSRKRYDTKAIQVARIVDEVARAIRRGAIPTTAPYSNEARPV